MSVKRIIIMVNILLGWSYKGYVIGNPFLSNSSPNPSQIMHFGISSIEEVN